MTKAIVSIAVGAFFAWLFGFGITQTLLTETPPKTRWDVPKLRKDVNRGNAYALCVLIVFACSVPIGLTFAPFPQSFQTFDRIFYCFIALIFPALFGVWGALPKRQ
jgi:hypothetical protein